MVFIMFKFVIEQYESTGYEVIGLYFKLITIVD